MGVRKAFLLPVAGAVSLLSGCATNPVKEPALNLPVPETGKKAEPVVVKKGGKPYEEIDTQEKDREFYNIPFYFNGGSLEDLRKSLLGRGITLVYPAKECYLPPSRGESLGEYLDSLEQICSLYWSGKRDFIRLEPFKTIIYRFPLPPKEGRPILESIKKALESQLRTVSLERRFSLERRDKEEKRSSLSSTSKERQEDTDKRKNLYKRNKENTEEADLKLGDYLSRGKDEKKSNAKREREKREQKENKKENFTSAEERNTGEKKSRGELSFRVKTSVSVIPEMSTLIVRTSPEDEKLVRAFVDLTAKALFSKQLIVKVVMLEVDESFYKELSLGLDFLKRAYRHEFTGSLGDNPSVSFTNLSQDYLSGIAHGLNLNLLINYIVRTGKGKIIRQTSFYSLPGFSAEMENSNNYPYLEPQVISLTAGGDVPSQSYQIKSVKDGFSIKISSSVVGEGKDSVIILSVDAKYSQFLGYQVVKAGTMGDFNLPLSSPREVKEIFRLSPGETTIIGGFIRYASKRGINRNLGIPRGDTVSSEKKRVLIFIKPRLVEYR